ncbi:MAG: molybdopterin-dependent oxidoreductase, partial [Chloroflexi bacterium]|nr:molybdopterin-dependent oxidoreductase [Chloroflexota bacterium]
GARYKFEQLFGQALNSPMVASMEPLAGTPLLANSLDALKTADCVIVAGADLTVQHQVAGFFIKRALPKGTKLIVIDGADNGFASFADCALTAAKGAKGATLAAIMSDPAAAKLVTGATKPVIVVGAAVYMDAAVKLAATLKAAIVNAQGQANSMAASAYKLDKAFEPKGRQAVYMALGDEKVLPSLAQQVEGAPFIAVQASYVSQVTAMADVVLPVEMWAETEGHYLNLDGRLQEAHCGITPPADIWASTQVFDALAERLGIKLDGEWRKSLEA